jgi:hypothetical protein
MSFNAMGSFWTANRQSFIGVINVKEHPFASEAPFFGRITATNPGLDRSDVV